MDNNWIIDNLNYAFGVWNDKLTEMWSLLTQSPQAFKGGTIWQTIQTMLSITENGYGKRTPIEEYRITNRGGMGIRNYMVTDKTGPVVGMKVVDGTEDLLLVTAAGILIRTPVENIRVAGRATQGVIVMRFKEEGDRVISLALADPEEKEQPASEEAPL